MESYTITHHAEEAECRHCGFPLYVGDRAVCTPAGVYCSKGCARYEASDREHESAGRIRDTDED